MHNILFKISLFTLIIFFASSIESQGELKINRLAINKKWDYLSKHLKYKLVTSTKNVNLKTKKYPVIKVTLTYTGAKQISIPWDEDFAYLLRDGNLILKSTLHKSQETMKGLKFQTSNTYSPGKSVSLKKGMTISATLNFTTRPGSYIKKLLLQGGPVVFMLYIIDSNGKWIPISNELTIIVN